MKKTRLNRREQQALGKRFTLLLTSLLALILLAFPAFASEDDACISCHGDYDAIHAAYGHNAVSQVGSVVLFADDAHDEAGWYGPKPYFSVGVNCTTCHTTDLIAVHANDCAKCHPTAYDQLGGPWQGTCQQGGCHVAYHEDSIPAHLPFEDHVSSEGSDCLICHNSATWAVPQTNCLNCHASYVSDSTPPVTTTDAQTIYEGGAVIKFSITDNGKVGIGTTFYQLDNESVTSGMQVVLNSPGQHTLEYWSVDQAGNVESPSKTETFEIFSDVTPPSTTATVQSTYYQGAVIKLIASDNSATGVKASYYRINGGPVQTGSNVVIPATPGTIAYTLDYWSVDWGYNTEIQKTANFTVISGHATLKLVWGDSDATSPDFPPNPGDTASWTVRTGSFTGPVVASGSASYPWSGVNNISVPLRPPTQKYFVRILWNSPFFWGESGQTDYPNIYPTAPGQVFRLSY